MDFIGSKEAFTARQLENFRFLLLSERAKIETESKTHFRSFVTKLSAEAENGRPSMSTHLADNNFENTLIEETALNNCQKRLRKIDEAIQRLDQGIYGICLGCFKPIPAKRLALIPIAESCVPCKERKERTTFQPNHRRHTNQRYSYA